MLSSFVLLLVSTTFLVQNNYYATQAQRTGVHDNARVATELIASEIRSAMPGGLVVAGPHLLTVRTPMVLGVICNRTGAGTADVHSEGGEAQLVTSEVAGVAVRDASTGAWSYGDAAWTSINGSDAVSASACFAAGADTTGASGEFHRLVGLDLLFSPVPSPGDVIMLYRETTFEITYSVLNTGSLGLYRVPVSGSYVEFASGIDSTAQFQYRIGVGPSFVDTVVAADIPNVNAVRIVAAARRPAQTGGREDITFGWSVNIPLRNVR